MKIYAKGTRPWEQAPSVNLSVEEVIKQYEKGFAGTYLDPEQRDLFTQISKETGGFTNVEDAANAYGWYGSFEGQLVIPFVHILENLPGSWPGPAQGRGDCQNGSDLVRMADGSQKQIKDIKVGEYVLSAIGEKRKVTNTFKKPYNGKMIQISVDGYINKIASTPDHKYIIDPYTLDGRPISELRVGDEVYLPAINYIENFTFDLKDYYDRDSITEDMDFEAMRIKPVDKGKIRGKNTSIQVNRYIRCDERLAWLAGIYAAEGGIDGDKGESNRITFNLGSHESIIAQQIKQYFIDIFGIEPYIYQVPSKPTVLYVRVSSSIIATFFKYLVSGNTYTKRLSKEWFISSRSIKLALLKGWFDGDGHGMKYGAVAVSASNNLITDMADIANSTGIEFNITKRKAYKKSRASNNIRIYSKSSKEFMKPKTEYASSVSIINKYGRMVKINSIREVEPEEQFVYCIEVEKDHNFICNGFGIFNCVSHSNKNALMGTLVCEAVSDRPDEETGVLEAIPVISVDGLRAGAFSTEVFYWYRGHGGDGWYCEASANVTIKQAGAVIRGPLEGSDIDLTKYSANLAGKWGRTAPPDSIGSLLNKNLLRTAARVTTFEGIRDSLGQGKFTHTCGSEGFGSTRDENGFSRRSGSWAHAMAYIAADDRDIIKKKYGGPLVLVLNSWGPRWNKGPRDILDSSKYVPAAKKQKWIKLGIVNKDTGNIMIPEGSFWAKWSDVARRDSSIFAGVNGWKRQRIESWGTSLLG